MYVSFGATPRRAAGDTSCNRLHERANTKPRRLLNASGGYMAGVVPPVQRAGPEGCSLPRLLEEGGPILIERVAKLVRPRLVPFFNALIAELVRVRSLKHRRIRPGEPHREHGSV